MEVLRNREMVTALELLAPAGDAEIVAAVQAGGGAGRSGSVGGVGLRGPGETQLEVARRELRKRISVLKKELERKPTVLKII